MVYILLPVERFLYQGRRDFHILKARDWYPCFIWLVLPLLPLPPICSWNSQIPILHRVSFSAAALFRIQFLNHTGCFPAPRWPGFSSQCAGCCYCSHWRKVNKTVARLCPPAFVASHFCAWQSIYNLHWRFSSCNMFGKEMLSTTAKTELAPKIIQRRLVICFFPVPGQDGWVWSTVDNAVICPSSSWIFCLKYVNNPTVRCYWISPGFVLLRTRSLQYNGF